MKRILIALLLVAGCMQVQAQSLRHVMRRAVVIANASQIPRDGLVAEYLFATDASDTSGNENNGGIFGATITNGFASFYGDDYIYVTNSSSLNITNEISVSVWSYANTGFLLGNYDYPNNARSWSINMDGDMNFTVCETGLALDRKIYEASSTADTWEHWAFTFVTNDLLVYKNERLVSTTPVTENQVNFLKYNSGPFLIGCVGNDATRGGFYTGYLDNIRIYNRVLSTNEIYDLYNEGHDE